jgi:predicted TIM-barrel fold metal-dependent hydrolase
MTNTQQPHPPLCLGPQRDTARPRHTLPPGSTDTHCHVFEADTTRYPLTPQRSYTPPISTLQDYLRMCATIGIERTVQVSASVYGFDNSLTLDIIRELGQDRARGVAGAPPDVAADELRRLYDGGIRGIRLSTHVKGYGGTELISALAPRVAQAGMHLQLHFDNGQELAALEAELMKTPVAMVFDHIGCVRAEDGVDSPGFQSLLRILRQRDDCWVKVSSWYRRSSRTTDGADMRPLALAVMQARPDRCLFGTNWPHPGLFAPAVIPNDGHLVDVFCEWVPDAALRQRILVDNPARLYGFPTA